ncbi:TIR domain-containing protein [bacterium]|nr:TIR domain-containing protein [bacterium]
MPDVFVSYSSKDRTKVLSLVDFLESQGVSFWLDRSKIAGGMNYGPEIVRGIKNCKVFLLVCTDASLRSYNVKQEIQLAWKYGRPYLPLLLEATNYPEQIEYWLEGWQWIEVYAVSSENWQGQLLSALTLAGVNTSISTEEAQKASQKSVQPVPVSTGLDGLRRVAKFTDQIWPVTFQTDRTVSLATRGLGAPQESVQHGHKLGSHLCLAIESERKGHLILLDEGPEGILYCLCPSRFAPVTKIDVGRTYLPQPGSRYDSFVVTGKPGREHLLAVLTDEPLNLDWMPPDPGIPAKVLNESDITQLLEKLRSLEGDRWLALSTYFDIIS